MKKKIFILTIIFLFAVIYLTPAKLVENLMPANPKVQVSGLSGSIWSGNIANISWNQLTLSDVEFALSPVSLLMAKISLALNFPANGDLAGQVEANLPDTSGKSITISNANLTIDSALIQQLIPMPGVLVNGKVQTKNLDLETANNKLVSAQGDIIWRNASVAISGQDWQLGEFVVKAETRDKTNIIVFEIVDAKKNKLDLLGKATISPDGMMEFVGSVGINIDQNIYNAISMFSNGKPIDGRLPIKYRQKIN
ncbi:type II secretion system protein N [Aliikangiella maris]|uniref:Type II secretion system protein N n=2 Tax=Aliikangiella maris TaxID=3162458 RepID=A0ABV2BXT0_9GAMM